MLQINSLLLFLALSIFNPTKINKPKKYKGSIEGFILNEHNQAVQNALIYLNKNTELIKVTTSDSLGKYEIKSIKPDTYTISVSYVGYYKKEIENITVDKTKKEIDIKMKELRCTHGDHVH